MEGLLVSSREYVLCSVLSYLIEIGKGLVPSQSSPHHNHNSNHNISPNHNPNPNMNRDGNVYSSAMHMTVVCYLMDHMGNIAVNDVEGRKVMSAENRDNVVELVMELKKRLVGPSMVSSSSSSSSSSSMSICVDNDVDVDGIAKKEERSNEFIRYFVDKYLRFGSIDDMIDRVALFDSVFLSNSELSPNGLKGPNKICKNSLFGLYMRSFLVRWESMLFEDICVFYDDLRKRTDKAVIAQPWVTSLSPSIASSSSSNRRLGSWFDGMNNSVFDIESLLRDSDALLNEQALHTFFDYGGLCTTSMPMISGGIVEDATVPSLPPFSLHNLAISASLFYHRDPADGASYPSSRHQLAMLCLSLNWLRVGNYQLALTAVEEASKTAQHRGDSATVAKCLLVMFHVLKGIQRLEMASEDGVGSSSMNHKANSSTSLDEAILLKCLYRAAECKLSMLSAQAAISLAKVRANKQLYTSNSVVGDLETNRDVQSTLSQNSGGNVPADILSLLSVCQIGLPKITSAVARGEYDPQMHGITVTSAPGIAAPAKVSAGDFSLAEITQLSLNLAIVSGDLWLRLGAPHMAILQYVRVFRAMVCQRESDSSEPMTFGNLSEFIEVSCKLSLAILEEHVNLADEFVVPLKTESTCMYLVASGNQESTRDDDIIAHRLQKCQDSIEVLRQLDSYLQELRANGEEIPLASSHLLEQTKLVVSTRLSLLRNDSTRALRLATRLFDTCNSDNNRMGVSTDRTIVVRTEAHALACLYFAAALARVNVGEALEVLFGLTQATRGIEPVDGGTLSHNLLDTEDISTIGVVVRISFEARLYSAALKQRRLNARDVVTATDINESASIRRQVQLTVKAASMLGYPSIARLVEKLGISQ